MSELAIFRDGSLILFDAHLNRMRNISPEHPAQLTSDASGILPASQPSISRRLMSIRIALQLSGTPPLSTVGHILLARYVAGHISLADLIPRLL